MMVMTICLSRFYVARITGYDDPEAVWGRELGYTDGLNLLILNLCASFGHLAPVRWVFLLPLEVGLALVFELPILLWDSPTPDAVPMFSLCAIWVAFLAAVGKRHSELQDRLLFRSLLSEKTRRFVAEHELARQHDEPAGATRGAGAPAAASAGASVPETASTAVAFEMDRAGGLGKMREVGIREQWLIDETEVKALPTRILGRGGFGVVTLGVYHNTPVALKEPRQDVETSAADQVLPALCNELRILRRLRHPNIVCFYGATMDDSFVRLRLVLEYIDGVVLRNFIQAHNLAASNGEGGDPTRHFRSSTDIVNERKRIVCDILSALRYLHSRTPAVVHGDLKDTNISVQQQCLHGGLAVRGKLLDFGLARLLTRSAQPLGGTTRWRAPELFGSERLRPDRAADVYSVGLLMFFISTAAQPFEGVDAAEVARERQRLRPLSPSWPEGRGDGDDLQSLRRWCSALVERCTRPRPEQRPTVADVTDMLDRGLDTWDVWGSVGAGGAQEDVSLQAQPPPSDSSLHSHPSSSALCVVFDAATLDVLETSPAFDVHFGACPPGSAVSRWLSPEDLQSLCDRVDSFCTSGAPRCTFDWDPRGLQLPHAPDTAVPDRVSVTLGVNRRGEEETVVACIVFPMSQDFACRLPDGDSDSDRP
mmetsp:Transcript_65445/g.175024  ORF Transcript_65445/g.175024 Transcript_65445/m.175024 type:complete len:652 (+) Transcript_65445:331-2286(+)